MGYATGEGVGPHCQQRWLGMLVLGTCWSSLAKAGGKGCLHQAAGSNLAGGGITVLKSLQAPGGRWARAHWKFWN